MTFLQALLWPYTMLIASLPLLLGGFLVLAAVGCRRGWKWARNPWLRLTHLLITGLCLMDAATLLGGGWPVTMSVGHYLLMSGPAHYIATSQEAEHAYKLATWGLGDGIAAVYGAVFLAAVGMLIFLPPWWEKKRVREAN